MLHRKHLKSVENVHFFPAHSVVSALVCVCFREQTGATEGVEQCDI